MPRMTTGKVCALFTVLSLANLGIVLIPAPKYEENNFSLNYSYLEIGIDTFSMMWQQTGIRNMTSKKTHLLVLSR